ncbi:MAG: 50S ribosomal protein L10 [Candidatus Colwellbacteria bacterium]|nr:50S ribosomal protein L10 [Candidatus Colwellbacteria bacterium]
MAIKKERKQEIVEVGTQDLNKAKALIFADFTGTSVTDMGKLRSELKSVGSRLRVIKKRLLGVIFKNQKIDYDPRQFDGPVGTVFVDGELSEAAGSLYRFAQDRGSFSLLGAYDLGNHQVIDRETITTLGSLPPRDTLLGQLIGTIAGPLRAFMYILSEKSKQS